MASTNLGMNLVGSTGVTVDAAKDAGPLELWRHTVGRGGINAKPLSERVITGIAKLKPRLVRVFLQEYFDVYPAHGTYNWAKLDPFLESMAKTGAKVLAAIAIKPKVLYPKIDQAIWRPNDVKEWQQLIGAMAKRYSVERKIVTHWNVGNECDIGENGGCPQLITKPEDYAEFYKMTTDPIVAVAPEAKIGGPAVANGMGDLMPGFLDICRRDNLRLDFIAWHCYVDDPARHARLVERHKKLLEPFGKKRPEMMVTEWNKGFDPTSVEDIAFEPRRCSNAAACLLAMLDAGLDWSFYYHFGDQVCYVKDFAQFFEKPEIMYHHWNEVPHRFGMFGVNEEARPQYFMYQMLGRMGDRRVEARADIKDLRILASRNGANCSVFVANYGDPRSEDRVVNLRFTGLAAGKIKELRVFRIDEKRSWCPEKLELKPIEQRELDVESTFECQVYCPADSVFLAELAE
jgi:hypothetical protein